MKRPPVFSRAASRNLRLSKPAPRKSSVTSLVVVKRRKIDEGVFVCSQAESEDSGLGDMSPCSRQSSMEGHPVKQDDLDWTDIDDSARTTFTFGRKHLECTAYAINQAQPFSSLHTDCNVEGSKTMHAPRHTDQNNSNFALETNYNGSNSMPVSHMNSSSGGMGLSNSTEYVSSSNVNSYSETMPANDTRRRHHTVAVQSQVGKYTGVTVIDSSDKMHSTPKHSGNNPLYLSEEWESELMDNLSSHLCSMNLDKQNTQQISSVSNKSKFEGGHSIVNQIPPKLDYLPDDIDGIEAELECLRDDLDLADSIKSSELQYFSSFKAAMFREQNIRTEVIREPLHPHSTQQEVQRAEEGAPRGMYTAKGRRANFRTLRLYRLEDNQPEKEINVIHYTAEELLQIGASCLSKREPECWAYLVEMYPNVCLSKINPLDTERYSEERSYVIETSVGCLGWPTRTNKRKLEFPNVNVPPPGLFAMKGSNAVTHGFRAPQTNVALAPSGFSLPVNVDYKQNSNMVTQSAACSNQSSFLADNQSASIQGDYSRLKSLNQLQKQGNQDGFMGMNLDSKCDVSVKDGSIRLFAAATRNILPVKSYGNFSVKRSISDPLGQRLAVGNEPQRFSDGRFPELPSRRFSRVPNWTREPGTNSFVNKNLPEKCPW